MHQNDLGSLLKHGLMDKFSNQSIWNVARELAFSSNSQVILMLFFQEHIFRNLRINNTTDIL